MAKKKNKKRPNRGGSIQTLLGREEKLRAEGKTARADKVQARINKRAVKNPETAAAVGESYAQKEFQTNLAANRPDQQAIGGSQTYETDPVTGKVTVTQSLDPTQQGLMEGQAANVGAANQAFASAFGSGQNFGQQYDWSAAPAAPDSGMGGRQRAEQAYIDSKTRTLDQSYDKRRQRVMDEMAGRGNTPGTPAWDKALADLDQNYNTELGAIGDQAITHAGQEFERSFNIGTQGRQNFIGENILGRTQPLSELSTLQGFGGGPTVQPNFFGFQPVQYQGPQYQDYLGMGVQQNQAQTGFGLDAQAIAAQGGGGGGGAPAAPQFSIGGLPPGGPPVIGSAPNPVTSGAASGFVTGVAAA
jgi:hypothetical protein